MPVLEGPVLVCALAFEERACGRPGPFGALGGGQVLLPSCLLLSGPGGPPGPDGAAPLWATLQLLVPRGDDAALAAGWRTLRAWAEGLRAVAAGPLPPVPQGAPCSDVAGTATDSAAQRAFVERVAQAQRALGPELEKVVLARMAALRAAVHPGATAQALRAAQGNTTAFALALPGGAHFLGATPETLVRLRQGQLHTEALAGTHPRGADGPSDAQAAAALMASGKERDEHGVVVRGMVRALRPHLQELQVPAQPEAVALRHMWHLRTPLSGQVLPRTDVLTLVQALHPTAALGGAPTAAAQRFLLAHEPWRRGLYAAPLGWVGLDGDGAFVAGIRSLWCDDAQAVLFAGAGIVAASSPQHEWQETALKLTTAAQSLRCAPGATETP